jgi:alpha-N-arabinofuranosidase
VPYLKLAAVHDDRNGTLTLFALNRSLTEELPLRLQAAGFSGLAPKQALQLGDADLKAVNTRQNPDRVVPRPLTSLRIDGAGLEAVLAPASWNVIQLAVSN